MLVGHDEEYVASWHGSFSVVDQVRGSGPASRVGTGGPVHQHAFSDRHSENHRTADLAETATVALDPDDGAADVHLIVDDIAEEGRLYDGALDQIRRRATASLTKTKASGRIATVCISVAPLPGAITIRRCSPTETTAVPPRRSITVARIRFTSPMKSATNRLAGRS